MKKIINLFNKFMNYLTRGETLEAEDDHQLRMLLTADITTAILMWSYAFNAYFTIDDYHGLKYMGFVYALLHNLSPFVYRYTRSVSLSTHLFLAAGFVFQYHHSMALGGFFSNTIIWFSILPFIAGVVAGLRELLIWATIGFIGVMSQMIFTFSGTPKNMASEAGNLWAQSNIAFGYILLNVLIMLGYLYVVRKHKEEMEEKNSQIRNLLRVLAHDISNPLTYMMSSHTMLQKDIPDEKKTKMMNNLKKGMNTIHDIVNNVREYESIQSSKKVFITKPVQVKKVVEEALKTFEFKLEDKKITVINEIEDKDITVMADMVSLKNQIISNLISNAIKFTPEGGTIRIFPEQSDPYYVLCIKDTGIGIEPEMIDKLFLPDGKTNRPGTNGEKGTGFGLPIVKQILNQFGAEINVESNGDGTTFKLIFQKPSELKLAGS
jgi:signal transduction histidine kinase